MYNLPIIRLLLLQSYNFYSNRPNEMIKSCKRERKRERKKEGGIDMQMKKNGLAIKEDV